jgi:hypothetical protein
MVSLIVDASQGGRNRAGGPIGHPKSGSASVQKPYALATQFRPVLQGATLFRLATAAVARQSGSDVSMSRPRWLNRTGITRGPFT